MRILGIDPGTARCGYAIIDYIEKSFKLINYGVITTSSNSILEQRLLNVYNETLNLIKKYEPKHMAIEELFFSKNTKTALSVAHSRGVNCLAGAQKKLILASYTPLQIKQSVVGYGKAEKYQIQKMVKIILKMKEIPKPDDAADAIAIAICHANSYNEKLL